MLYGHGTKVLRDSNSCVMVLAAMEYICYTGASAEFSRVCKMSWSTASQSISQSVKDSTLVKKEREKRFTCFCRTVNVLYNDALLTDKLGITT